MCKSLVLISYLSSCHPLLGVVMGGDIERMAWTVTPVAVAVAESVNVEVR